MLAQSSNSDISSSRHLLSEDNGHSNKWYGMAKLVDEQRWYGHVVLIFNRYIGVVKMYLLAIIAMTIFTFSIGLIVAMSFTLRMGGNYRYWSTWPNQPVFSFLPAFFILVVLATDQFVVLLFDAIDAVPFAHCRGHFLAALCVMKKDEALTHRELFGVDLFFILILNIIPTNITLGYTHRGQFWHGFWVGQVCSAFLLLLTYFLTTCFLLAMKKWYVQPKDPKEISNFIKRSHMYVGSVGTLGLTLGLLWVRLLIFSVKSFQDKCGVRKTGICLAASVVSGVVLTIAFLGVCVLLSYDRSWWKQLYRKNLEVPKVSRTRTPITSILSSPPSIRSGLSGVPRAPETDGGNADPEFKPIADLERMEAIQEPGLPARKFLEYFSTIHELPQSEAQLDWAEISKLVIGEPGSPQTETQNEMEEPLGWQQYLRWIMTGWQSKYWWHQHLWVIVSVAWVMWVRISSWLYNIGHEEPAWATCVSFFMGLLVVLVYALALTRQFTGVTFWTSFAIGITVALFFMSLSMGPLRSLASVSAADPVPMMLPCSKCQEMADRFEIQAYPVCGQTWGSPSVRMTVLELGALSSYAYQSMNEVALAEMINQTFGNRHAQYIRRIGYEIKNEDLPISTHVVVVRFPPEPPATRGTVVVSFRGTATPDDVLLDASIYTIIDLTQMANTVVVPLLSILPSSYIRSFLRMIRSDLQDRILRNFTEVTHSIMMDFENDSFVLTGHSLGGLVAQTLGTKMHGKRIETVVFSAPGSGWMSASFGEDRDSESMNKYTVIIPHHDPGPMVDVHMGVRQPIECRDGHSGKRIEGFNILSFFVAPACHSIQRTICELWRTCGDTQYNFSRCIDANQDFAVDAAFVGKQYPSPDWATGEM